MTYGFNSHCYYFKPTTLMPQLDITTFYTQSFWLIIIFILRYLRIGNQFLPQISYIIKYRSEYQEERDWTLTVLSNEISTYGTLLMDLRAQIVHVNKIINHFNNTKLNRKLETTKYIQNSNKLIMTEILELKYDILAEIDLTNID